jgi:hypothetical protein
MEETEPARRRPHPQGRNAEEDGRDAVFWSAALARNGKARGKNCGKRSAGRCGYEATGRLASKIRGSIGCAANVRRFWQQRCFDLETPPTIALQADWLDDDAFDRAVRRRTA